MHLVGFVIRIYHDARSLECQTPYKGAKITTTTITIIIIILIQLRQLNYSSLMCELNSEVANYRKWRKYVQNKGN